MLPARQSYLATDFPADIGLKDLDRACRKILERLLLFHSGELRPQKKLRGASRIQQSIVLLLHVNVIFHVNWKCCWRCVHYRRSLLWPLGHNIRRLSGPRQVLIGFYTCNKHFRGGNCMIFHRILHQNDEANAFEISNFMASTTVHWYSVCKLVQKPPKVSSTPKIRFRDTNPRSAMQNPEVEIEATQLPKKRTFEKFSFRGVDLNALLDMNSSGFSMLMSAVRISIRRYCYYELF